MPDIPANGLNITAGPTLEADCSRPMTLGWSAGSGDLFHLVAPGPDYECYYLQVAGAANPDWHSTSRYQMVGTASAGTFTLLIDGIQILLDWDATESEIQDAFDLAGIVAVVSGDADDFTVVYDDAPASAVYANNLIGATMFESETGVPSLTTDRGTTDLSLAGVNAPALASDGSLIFRIRTLFGVTPPGSSNVITVAPVSGLRIEYAFDLSFAGDLQAGDLIFLAILIGERGIEAPPAPSASFPGLSFTQIATFEIGTLGKKRLSVLKAVAPASLNPGGLGIIILDSNFYDDVHFAAAALPGFNTLIATSTASGHSSTATVSISPDPSSALLALAAVDHIDTVNWAPVVSVGDGGPEIIWEGPQSVHTDPEWLLTDPRSWAVVAVELQRT